MELAGTHLRRLELEVQDVQDVLQLASMAQQEKALEEALNAEREKELELRRTQTEEELAVATKRKEADSALAQAVRDSTHLRTSLDEEA